MSESLPSRPVCIACGQPAVYRGEWNRLPTGEPCPTCRERLLDAIPAALPAAAVVAAPADLDREDTTETGYDFLAHGPSDDPRPA